MAFENYVKLAGSERQPMAGAKKTAAADPNALMQATIVLRPRSSSAEAEPLAELVARGERLTRAEYQARYGADPADVQAVLAFTSGFGLALMRVDLGRAHRDSDGKDRRFQQGVPGGTCALRTHGRHLSRTHRRGQRTARVDRHYSQRARSGQSSAGEAAFSAGEKHRAAERCRRSRGILYGTAGRQGVQFSNRSDGEG